MAHRPPPHPFGSPLDACGGTGPARTPAGRAGTFTPLPTWLNDRAGVRAGLDRRAPGDGEKRDLWDGVLLLTCSINVLRCALDREDDLVPTAWATACWLSERLPAPAATVLPAPPALLDADADTDALLDALDRAVSALVGAVAAPEGADDAALLADVSATVCWLTPLLAKWDQQVGRIRDLLDLIRDIARHLREPAVPYRAEPPVL